MTEKEIKISEFDYNLPEERIAKFPLDKRDESKLLIYRDGDIHHRQFKNIAEIIPANTLLVFNNAKVIRARIIMHKPSGARIEVFCLEPHCPADYERAFAIKGECEWKCMVGNLKKWKSGPLEINFEYNGTNCCVTAERGEQVGNAHIIRFRWDTDLTFGQLLEHLGRIPIPPYLNRESQEVDNTRYQTVYSKFEGSVAAPTAGLHFSTELIEQMKEKGFMFEEVTLHVGAGTFLPVKDENAAQHTMHTEHFEFSLATIERLADYHGKIIPVGTTSVRTLESISALAYRIINTGTPDAERTIGQWEIYDIPSEINGKELLVALRDYMRTNNMDRIKSSTQIMITPGYRFRIIEGMVTNFHQPKSTLLLLVSALVGDDWKKIYAYAMENEFRFLSYGDSSILFKPTE